MGIYDEQRMADLADYLADDDDCDDGPDWIPGCDSIANHCESYPYNSMIRPGPTPRLWSVSGWGGLPSN